jgi:hypothetical protein
VLDAAGDVEREGFVAVAALKRVSAVEAQRRQDLDVSRPCPSCR